MNLILFYLQDGKPLDIPNPRFEIEVTPDAVIITDKKAEKDDTGKYDVTLENEKGKDTVPIQVNVKCPPGSPEGPLEVSKVTAESCTLKWNPPKVSWLKNQNLMRL